jgi:hypothetical protein
VRHSNHLGLTTSSISFFSSTFSSWGLLGLLDDLGEEAICLKKLLPSLLKKLDPALDLTWETASFLLFRRNIIRLYAGEMHTTWDSSLVQVQSEGGIVYSVHHPNNSYSLHTIPLAGYPFDSALLVQLWFSILPVDLLLLKQIARLAPVDAAAVSF